MLLLTLQHIVKSFAAKNVCIATGFTNRIIVYIRSVCMYQALRIMNVGYINYCFSASFMCSPLSGSMRLRVQPHYFSFSTHISDDSIPLYYCSFE